MSGISGTVAIVKSQLCTPGRVPPTAGSRPHKVAAPVCPAGAVYLRRSPGGRLVLWGIIGLLIATCIGAGAITLRSHGDAAKQMIARWAPQPELISFPAAENPVPPQPIPPAVQVS